jgi:hypothetical protein
MDVREMCGTISTGMKRFGLSVPWDDYVETVMNVFVKSVGCLGQPKSFTSTAFSFAPDDS